MDDELFLRGLRIACVITVAPMVAGLVSAVLREARRRRVYRPRPAPGDPERCLACGAPVQLDEEDIYLCGECHYQGGPGLMARARWRRQAEIAAMSPEERDRTVREAVDRAHLLLDLAEPVLARFRSRVDVPESVALHAQMLAGTGVEEAFRQVQEAWALLERAAEVRGASAGAPPALEPEMWIDQLGQLDAACVRADIDRAADGIRRGREAATRLLIA